MRIVSDDVMERAAIAARSWAKENVPVKSNADGARWAYEAGYREACNTERALSCLQRERAAEALATRFGGVAANYGEVLAVILNATMGETR